jgi:hypothetical protein
MIETETKPKISPPDYSEMLEHICHPENRDLSLCGKDISDEPWDHGGPVCQACVYILNNGPGILN